MATVDATLCLPFKQTHEVIKTWEQSVLEACKRTCFPYEEEVTEVLSDIRVHLPPLLYARLIDAIGVIVGTALVRFRLRYDAEPNDEDEVDLALLDLVLDPPGDVTIVFECRDMDRAIFLGGLALAERSTAHVTVLIAPAPAAAEEGDL